MCYISVRESGEDVSALPFNREVPTKSGSFGTEVAADEECDTVEDD